MTLQAANSASACEQRSPCRRQEQPLSATFKTNTCLASAGQIPGAALDAQLALPQLLIQAYCTLQAETGRYHAQARGPQYECLTGADIVDHLAQQMEWAGWLDWPC